MKKSVMMAVLVAVMSVGARAAELTVLENMAGGMTAAAGQELGVSRSAMDKSWDSAKAQGGDVQAVDLSGVAAPAASATKPVETQAPAARPALAGKVPSPSQESQRSDSDNREKKALFWQTLIEVVLVAAVAGALAVEAGLGVVLIAVILFNR